MKVGFFDSGLGGLTVLKEAVENEMLSEDIYYLADTKNTPYGVKDENFVEKVINENIKYLIDLDCNPIVIACNTATSLCINELRNNYKDITFIGTEPAVKVAADSKMNKKILVLATSITVRREKLLNLIDKLNIKDSVELVAADKLVTFAENVECNNMTDEINSYIESIISKFDINKFSHIVLGCTHFPLFKDNFYSVLNKINPENKIQVIDGAKGISNNLIKHINEIKNNKEYVQDNKNITIILTSKNDDFIVRARQILTNDKIEVEYKLQ